MTITFIDGSTISANASGFLYAGEYANKVGHTIRRYNITPQQLRKWLLDMNSANISSIV